MWREAVRIWCTAIGQRQVWAILLWTTGFAFLFALLLWATGTGMFLTALTHLTSPASSSAHVVAVSGGSLWILLVFCIILLLAGPFMTNKTYALFGQAVAGKRVSPGLFWHVGVGHYGSGLAFVLFLLVWSFLLGLASAILIAFFQTVGVLLTGAIFLLSWPWILRMLGGLYLDARTWEQSFARMFRVRNYWFLVVASFVTFVLLAGLLVGDLVLLHKVTPLGIVTFWLSMLGLSVAGPVWFLSLYRASEVGASI